MWNWWDGDDDRSWQVIGTIYELPDGVAFVTNDGEGRVYYDSVEDAMDETGETYVVTLDADDDLRGPRA